MKNLNMSMHDTIEFIFSKNTNNEPVLLSLQQLNGDFDLFLFLIDVLCKGFILLYGENGRLNVDNLTNDQIIYVKQKLKNTGIELVLESLPFPEDGNAHIGIAPYIIKPPFSDKLEDYQLIIVTPQHKHAIHFKLLRH
jgi:hypothetical protein